MQADGEPARLALVVGNADYQSALPLKNPRSDAHAVAASLVAMGFTVRTEYDLDGERFQRVVGEFINSIAEAATKDAGDAVSRPVVALLFYAGHGVQVRGENYFLPVDGDFSTEADLQLRTVNLGIVMQAMNTHATTSIVMLDCCRDNPLPRTVGDGRTRSIAQQHGLAGIDVPNGTFVAFATQPDAVAEDGSSEHSPFTDALLRYISTPDVHISEMMIHVRRTVHETTSGRQIPWDRSALFQPFAFCLAHGLAHPEPVDPAQIAQARLEAERAREAEYWSLIENSESGTMLQSFVMQFPHSPRRADATAKIDRLRYRRWRNGLVQTTAAIVLGFVVLVAGFVVFESLRFSSSAPDPAGGRRISLKNADLIGNDITLTTADARGISRTWCRIKCIFDTRCVAFSWTPAREADKGSGFPSTCYPKRAATHFKRPKNDNSPSDSEYLRKRGRKAPTALPADWTLHWASTLVGEPVPAEKALADPDFRKDNGKDVAWLDGRTRKPYFKVTNALCHRRCEALGPECKGFSYSPFGKRCELFKSVVGIARDVNKVPVHTPTVHSLCNDLDVEDCKTDH